MDVRFVDDVGVGFEFERFDIVVVDGGVVFRGVFGLKLECVIFYYSVIELIDVIDVCLRISVGVVGFCLL